MDSEERTEFNFDVNRINWNKAVMDYCFGIQRYYFKEDRLAPEAGFEQVLAQNQIEWFHDVK